MAMMNFPSVVGEISSSGDELTSKVRKPYTITKQRERWTEEEHLKFLEALKLYGRAWRRIEEHIGTKTAVQIRSHAQKFFSKLVRGSSGRGVSSSTERAQNIEIPPPRPKRKPRHPYPRKAGAIQLTAKDESTSPSAVSSANLLGLEDKRSKNVVFSPCDAKSQLNGLENKLESSQVNDSPLSLKLFGQTMLVAATERSTVSSSKPAERYNSQGAFQEFVSVKQETIPGKIETEDQMLDNQSERLFTLGLDRHTIQATDSAVQSGSPSNSVTNFERKAIMLMSDAVSSAAKDSREKQYLDVHMSSGQEANLSSFSRNQNLPGIVPGCPRHIPIQSIVDGMISENGHEDIKSRPSMIPLLHSSSAMGFPYGIDSLSQLRPMFPWIQMQQGDTSVAEVVAAATVAAASAWLSLCGALPTFLHPSTFGTATGAVNPLSACKAESMMGATEKEGANMAEGAACNLMKEYYDTQDPGENLSCQTEEQGQAIKDKELANERSSSSSSTPSSNDPECDSYLGTSTGENRQVCVRGSHYNGGRCASEEDSSKEEEDTHASNNGRWDKAEKHFLADICKSRTGGDHCIEKHREGQTTFDALFFQEVLPQTFSGPCSVGGGSSKENIRRNKSPFASREEGHEDSEATTSHQFTEESVANLCEADKFVASSTGKSKSGVGFVPYRRCSAQAKKTRLHSQSVDSPEDVLREEKRICSRQ